MTTPARFERDLPDILSDLAMGPEPDYVDSVLMQTGRMRQRPAWTFPERWFPMSMFASRLVAAPPIRWRTIAVIALLVIALAAGAAFIVGTRRQALPAPFGAAANGPIISSWRGEIYVRDTFAAEPRILIGGPEDDAIAGYSRDGTRIAFFRKLEASQATYNLWAAGTDGSAPTRLGGPFDRSSWDVFDWSPLGEVIAVSYVEPASGGDHPVIDLVPTDGSGPQRLELPMDVADPAWRPGDAGQLAFRGEGPDGSAVYLAQHDGSAPVRLALDASGPTGSDQDFKNLSWSPSGDKLTYNLAEPVPGTATDVIYRLYIATIGPAGEVLDQRRLTDSTAPEHEYQPAWLPSGDELVYHRQHDNSDSIMVRRLDGGPARDLGLTGQEYVVSISPDGTHLYALNHETLVVSDVDLATGATTQGFNADWSTTMSAISQRLAPRP